MDDDAPLEKTERVSSAEATTNNEKSAASNGDKPNVQDSSRDSWMCVVGEELRTNDDVTTSGKALNLSVAYTTEPVIPDNVPSGCVLAFICNEFDGPLFEKLWSRVRSLKSSRVRILGPPCLHYCAAAKVDLPLTRRPIYSLSMSGVSVCFMGFKAGEKKTMDSLVNLVRHMGADVRTDVSEVSHVVAPGVTSSRYERAVALGKSIMSTEWITECWKQRDQINVRATDEKLMHYRLPPFTDLTLSFYGFDEEDRSQMEDFCQQYGGTAVPFGELCTHVVCSAEITQTPATVPASCAAVKMEWFWESIQIRACSNVALHRFDMPLLSSPAPGKSPMYHRRRTIEPSVAITPTTQVKSSATLPGHRSARIDDTPRADESTACSADAKQQKKLNERRNKCLELQNTEDNYVAILKYIVEDFVKPLEMPNQLGGAILNPEEVKEIFYPLPQLAALHEKMLDGLYGRFSPKSFDHSTCFGDILLAHMDEMIRIYPRFINFYEGRQECVLKKCKSNARFTAFIQLRYSEASKVGGAFSRQKLKELLITPVQRMPRYLLLVEGIIKLTSDDHQDKPQLVKALEGFRQAAQRINEDKRIAERRMAILNLPNVIENLPPTVLTSARTISSVINNLVLLEVGEGESMEIPVSLVVFNDSIEITKRRGGRDAVTMEELTASSGSNSLRSSAKKPLRHIDFLMLKEIKRLLHFESAEESTKTNLLGIGVTTSTGALAQEQWIILRVMSSSSQSPMVVLNDVTETLLKAREDSLHVDSHNQTNFLQVVSTEVLPFPYDANVTDSSFTPTTGLGKAIKGARHKAKKVTRVFSHQVHRLEGLTPRRTGLRRSYAPPSNVTSRRHVFLDSVSFTSICESPSANSLTACDSMTSLNSSTIPRSNLPATVLTVAQEDDLCRSEHVMSSAINAASSQQADTLSCSSTVSISPTKRKNSEAVDDSENLEPGHTGSLSKRRKEDDGAGSLASSSSVEEFRNLPLTLL